MRDNPTGLTYGEVSTSMVQMAQTLTLQAQAKIAQARPQGVLRKNPPASTMSSRLRDFKRMNSPIYTGSKSVENLEEECRVNMLHASMALSRLMFHIQQVEESRKRKNVREGNR